MDEAACSISASQDAGHDQAANLKIRALTLELAHHRRIRFGNRARPSRPSSANSSRKPGTPTSGAIEPRSTTRIRRSRQNRQSGARPAASRCPESICARRISSRARLCCWRVRQNLVKIGEDVGNNSMWSRRASSCGVTSARVRLPWVRNGVGGGDPARRDRRGHGGGGFVRVGDHRRSTWILPLYPLEQIAARDGVILSRSTLARWVGRIGVALQPLADRLAALLRERTVLHADDPLGPARPRQGKDTSGLSVGLPQ